MALPPLELFSLKEGAALLPGGSFRFYGASHPAGARLRDSSPLPRPWTHIPSLSAEIQARFLVTGPDFTRCENNSCLPLLCYSARLPGCEILCLPWLCNRARLSVVPQMQQNN